MEPKTNRIKPRYIFLALSTLFLIILFTFSIIKLGQDYKSYAVYNFKPEKSKIVVQFSEKDVVKVTNIEIEKSDGIYIADISFKSVGKGTTVASIKYEGKKDKDDHTLRVNSLGIIYEGKDSLHSASNSYKALLPTVYIFILILTIVLTLKFREMKREGKFTYSMVAVGGIILYFIGNIISLINALIPIFTESSDIGMDFFAYFNIPSILNILAQSGVSFAFIAAPIVFMFALAVSVSNISLIRHEGLRPLNLLGIFFGLIIVGGFILLCVITLRDFQGSEFEYKIFSSINIAFSFAFCYLECMLLSTIICSFMATRYKPAKNQDYIIILGCALRKDGTPTPILRSRIDRAVEFEKEQFNEMGKHAVFVPSGGQGADEVVSEAESMKNYLLKQNIPEEQILPEDKSVNTYQNMKFSKKKIEENTKDSSKTNIAFSTTNYHVFRGYILSKKIGMKAKGLSAKTKLYFFPNAFIREFIGLLFEEKLKHILFIGLIIILFIAFMLFGT